MFITIHHAIHIVPGTPLPGKWIPNPPLETSQRRGFASSSCCGPAAFWRRVLPILRASTLGTSPLCAKFARKKHRYPGVCLATTLSSNFVQGPLGVHRFLMVPYQTAMCDSYLGNGLPVRRAVLRFASLTQSCCVAALVAPRHLEFAWQ